ncbi:MAG: hypothetical protein H6752_09415 [Candidatus Omnitrophica bacterium]|nr:hypothetical protein [Candidatus Omnitrophota bacterium]
MEESVSNRRKRPFWVWVISIFFLISVGWTFSSFYLVLSGAVPLNPEQEEYFTNLSAFDYTSTLGLGVLNLLGAVSLFLLHRAAFYFFAFAFGVNVLLTIWHAVAKGWLAVVGGPGLVGMVLGLGILFAVCVYSWRLLQSGILR